VNRLIPHGAAIAGAATILACTQDPPARVTVDPVAAPVAADAHDAGVGSSEPDTIVTKLAPAIPAGVPERTGSCWTQSIASSRDDAWRCRMGNAIVDPCFSVPGVSGVVACGANPATGEAGFPLRLDAPLPARIPETGPVRPWLLLLADGEVCAPFTGTMPRVGAEHAQWYCGKPGSASSGSYVSRVEPDRTWRATHYDESGEAARGAPMAVRRVWE